MSVSHSVNRRLWLQNAGGGLGYLALASLLAQDASGGLPSSAASEAHGAAPPLAEKPPHFAPRAKRVIMMFMQGGPSHIDTFDSKPMLARYADRTGPALTGLRRGGDRLLPSPWKFKASGESGLEISELFPNLSRHADQLCLLNGMHTDNPAHPQATVMMHTGSVNFVRPSMGSWIVYGLGTSNQNLPGFVTINGNGNPGGQQNYGSAFLPATYQGTRIAAGPQPLADLRNPRRQLSDQRRQLDLIQAMNHDAHSQDEHHPELEGIITSYELAFRMQSAVPQLMDLSTEPVAVQDRYGLGDRATADFGMQCLMARRLAEAGVRFIEIRQGGWDHHNGLRADLPASCRAVDQPIAALIGDLQQRGLLRDTLLVWTGEFGRTPHQQGGRGDGRRHNHQGFTTWLAGGGVRGGMRHGATDEIGYQAAAGRVHIHDLHATILHLLGLDHEQLTYRYAGRDFRLTDVHGQVIQDILGRI